MSTNTAGTTDPAMAKATRIEEIREDAHRMYGDEADQSIEDQEDLRDIDEILDML